MLAPSGKLDRRELTAALLKDRGDMLVIAGLGAPAWDITAVGDRAENLPLWGAMGGAAMIGLGLALAQPSRTVLVITGDGEMLMGIGSLATIAVQAPRNLSIVVQDNDQNNLYPKTSRAYLEEFGELKALIASNYAPGYANERFTVYLRR